MTMTDPIADFLTRLRNANSAYHDEVTLPHSKIKANIAEILKKEGYISDYRTEDARVGKSLVVQLKYGPSRERSIAGLRRVSKPGLRVYAKSTNLPRVLGGLGVAIISTSSGLLTDRQAARQRRGRRSPRLRVVRGTKNMSRIGKQPVLVPAGVDVTIDGRNVSVKGPKGTLTLDVAEPITVERNDDGAIVVSRPDDERRSRSLHGLSRTLVANLVTGVTEGYTRKMEIFGVGYRVQLKGSNLEFALGYSHPVVIEAPEGITFAVETPTKFSITGIDKQKVGQISAVIRRLRRPDPYKGKGVRYEGEQIRRKVGKTGK